jgi:uncharacterized RDD family membrane protein YckC
VTAYVGLGARLLAALIDFLAGLVVFIPFAVAVTFAVDAYSAEQTFNPRSLETLAYFLLPGAVILFWRYCGATPGKMAIGARIVDAKTGGAPGAGRLVVRFLAYVVSALPLYLGFLWMAWDRRKQGWHDKIAGTIVVYED